MKKFLLLFGFAITCGINVNAQGNTLALVEEGKTWHIASLIPTGESEIENGNSNVYQDLNGHLSKGITSEYVLRGDTIMNNRAYKRLINISSDEQKFICGLRQEGSQIYRCDSNIQDEYLIFDFGLNEGDIFTLPQIVDETQMCVISVELVSINGTERRVLKMKPYEESTIISGWIDIWIEGIGCLSGPSNPWWWLAIGMSPLLLDCCQDGHMLITTDDLRPLTASIQTFEKGDNNSKLGIYDFSGRKSQQLPHHGIYIKGKRKYVK